MKKGQFSLEFLIVFGVLLTILATISLPLYNDSRTTTAKITSTMEAREAANELVLALNSGSGFIDTRQTAEYWLPSNVVEVKGISLENELHVNIIVNQNDENISIKVPTQLPGYWENKVALENIQLPEDNRARHKTVMTLKRDKEIYQPDYKVIVADEIMEGG